MATKRTDISQRERILQTAAVAKATGYHLVPAREELCQACLRVRNSSELDALTVLVHDHDTPRARFLAVMASVQTSLYGKESHHESGQGRS